MLHLDQTSQLTFQRTLQIILSRFGRPDETIVTQLVAKIDPLFPSESAEMNWLLSETLAWLESPNIAKKAIAMIQSVPTQEEQMQYARSIRLLQAGLDERTEGRLFRMVSESCQLPWWSEFCKVC